MRKYPGFLLVILLFTFYQLSAQETSTAKPWWFEAGPYVGFPAWSFGATHKLGFGVNAKVVKELGSHFSGGGAISFGHFLGKDIGLGDVKGFNMLGIYANLQYTYFDEYFVGGDLGLGLSFSDGHSTAGFARTGYLGYQFKTNAHPLSLALYLNRTTVATYNIGVKSWYRF